MRRRSCGVIDRSLTVCDSYNDAIPLTKGWQDQVWQASALEGLTVALVIQGWAPRSTRFDVRHRSICLHSKLTTILAGSILHRQFARWNEREHTTASTRHLDIPLCYPRPSCYRHRSLRQNAPSANRSWSTAGSRSHASSHLRRIVPTMRSVLARRLGSWRMDRESAGEIDSSSAEIEGRSDDVDAAS